MTDWTSPRSPAGAVIALLMRGRAFALSLVSVVLVLLLGPRLLTPITLSWTGKGHKSAGRPHRPAPASQGDYRAAWVKAASTSATRLTIA